MTTLLVDPWIAEFSGTDQPADDNRFIAISILLELQKSTPLEFTRFLDNDFLSDFYTQHRTVFRGTFGESLSRFLKHLELNGPTDSKPAEFVSGPIPNDCNEAWCSVLAEQAETDDAPSWRYPMVMVPEVRDAEWPQEDQINFNVDEGSRLRNLIRIERYQTHPYFQPDLDPWRLKACGEPDRDTRHRDDRRPTWKRLPRPPELPDNLSFLQLQQALLQDIPSTNADGTEWYFVPAPVGWNPNVYERDQWRNCRVFNYETVLRGKRSGKSGPVDREGQIWIWDVEKSHWDVQLKGGLRHENISDSGRKLKST